MREQVKKIALGMIILSFILSIGVAGFRIQAESQYDTIQVGVRYADLLKIAEETSKTFEQVLVDFKDLGVTTLIVRENTILSPKEGEMLGEVEQGRVELVEGKELVQRLDDINIDADLLYIVTEEMEVHDRLYEHLTKKGEEVLKGNHESFYTLGIEEDRDVLSTVGVGFVEEDLELASRIGYAISPEIRAWESPTEESILWMINEIASIPSLNYIYFEDVTIPGYDSLEMANLVKTYGLGFVEFFTPNQVGFNTLAYASRNDVGEFNLVRMFTDEKVPNISTPDRVARYDLALTERGIRVFTFILEEGNTIEQESKLKEDIQTFLELAESRGYTLSKEQMVYRFGDTHPLLSFAIGMAGVGILMLILDGLNLKKLSLIIGVFAIGGYGLGIYFMTDISIQAMALMVSILFPVYAIVSQVKPSKPLGYKEAIKIFLTVSAITLVGGFIVVGLLSQTPYMLGLEGFRGVKVAHSVPLAMIAVFFIYYYRKQIQLELRQLLQTKVSYKPILFILSAGVIGAIFIIYMMRTGNGEISEWEKLFRQGLDQLLGVRPRTKEFLIGHPLFVLMLYFGYKGIYLPVLLLATVGQISLINTYAHIHTPLWVSLIRSAYGIGIGMIIGIILIQVVKFIFKVINKWIIKQK